MASNESYDDQRQRALESWKAIAAYLNRSERTVRRWERVEGLPVHRHRHDRGATVYAHRRELDAWLLQRRTVPADPSESAPLADEVGSDGRDPAMPRSSCGATGLALLAVAVVVATAWLSGPGSSDGPARVGSLAVAAAEIAIAPWVRVGPEPAAEVATDVVVALSRALQGSEAVRQVSAAPVLRALRSMGRDGAALVEEAVTAQALERAGRPAALLVPRLDARARELSVSVTTRGSDGAPLLFTTSWPPGARPDAPGFARRIVDALEQVTLPPAQASGPAPIVTTPSLEAYRAYVAAESLLDAGETTAALALLGDALRADPGFVMADAQRVWEVGTPTPDRGVAGAASRSERYYARAARSAARGDLARARVALSVHLELEPESYWGRRRALSLCRRLEPPGSCLGHAEALVRARPADPRWSYEAAREAVMLAAGDRQTGRLVAIATAHLDRELVLVNPGLAAEIAMLPARRSWLAGSQERSLEQVDGVLGRVLGWPVTRRDPALAAIVAHYLSLGRVAEAARSAGMIYDAQRRRIASVRIAMETRDTDALKRQLTASRDAEDPFLAFMMTGLGMSDVARGMLARLDEERAARAPWRVVSARLAMVAGRRTEGIARMRAAIAGLEDRRSYLYILGLDTLAQAYGADGDLDRAAAVLESSGADWTLAAFDGSISVWRLCQRRLAGFYRRMDRLEEATELEASLRASLRLADPDHRLL